MRPISLKDHRESSTDHRDTYGMTSKSLQMCPSRGNAKRHSRPSRDDGRRVTRLLLPPRPPPLLHSKGSRRRRGCQAAVSEAPSVPCCAALRAASAPIVFAPAQHARTQTHVIDPCCTRLWGRRAAMVRTCKQRRGPPYGFAGQIARSHLGVYSIISARMARSARCSWRRCSYTSQHPRSPR